MFKKVVPHTEEYEMAVAQLAHIALPSIIPCGACGHPTVGGYSCMFCKTDTPTDEQRREFQEWLQKAQE